VSWGSFWLGVLAVHIVYALLGVGVFFWLTRSVANDTGVLPFPRRRVW
jgi:hypothetical protein